MPKRLTTQHGGYLHPATVRGQKPGDFPLGSLKSRVAARALLADRRAEELRREAADFGELNAFEQAFCEGSSGGMRRQAIFIAAVLQANAEAYGSKLPTPDEIRHSRAVGEILRELTGDKILWGGPEETRLRALAEEKFQERFGAKASIQEQEKRTKAQPVDEQK